MIPIRRANRYSAIGAGLLAVCASVSQAPGEPATSHHISRPDTFLARVVALASMETLNADLLASRSATRTLEAWCAAHDMANHDMSTHDLATHDMAKPARLRAERVAGPDKPLDAGQRARLAIGPLEPVRYRHVRLACGTHVLSDADNWYVPSRLTPAMNATLDATDTSFGTVVAPLDVTRETFAARTLWAVLPPGWDMGAPVADHPERTLDVPPLLFEHRAVLFDSHHTPFSEVDEHYTNEVLAFTPAR